MMVNGQWSMVNKFFGFASYAFLWSMVYGPWTNSAMHFYGLWTMDHSLLHIHRQLTIRRGQSSFNAIAFPFGGAGNCW